ncbi:MAG TPA: MBL fold metallo-hydrolase [Nocardioidaceae bacterium]|nr:MBL fold metallo-hydrolase [Nocardioidaceae bacterium]
MRITKFGHACVRVESGSTAVVVDPGGWSEREAVDGASVVLVTHEHPDHLDPGNLRATDAPVYTIGAVAKQIAEQAPDVAERVTVVKPGDVLDLGIPVTVVGEKHAVIHPELQHFDNSGYLLEVEGRRVFHPGDAFTERPEALDLLLLPVHAPWNKVSEVIDYARAVGAPLSVAIHDGLLNERGLALAQRQLSGMLGEREQEYLRVEPGTEVPLA